jgi:hypothetical protein
MRSDAKMHRSIHFEAVRRIFLIVGRPTCPHSPEFCVASIRRIMSPSVALSVGLRVSCPLNFEYPMSRHKVTKESERDGRA